jgi:ADP-heptose:LPS heptosyltransferase
MQPLLADAGIASLAIFRALHLGDMLCAVPALRALRAALPAASITLIGLPWAEQLAARFPRYIDHFLAFPGHAGLPEQPVRPERLTDFYAAARAARFDLALQMHGSGAISNGIVQAFGARLTAGFAAGIDRPSHRAGQCFTPYPDTGAEPLRLLGLTEWLGAPTRGTHLEFPLTEEDERELERSGVAAGLVPGRYICLHPGARTRDKCWPARHFAAVADQLAEQYGLAVALTGSNAEVDLTGAVAGAMRTPAVDTAGPLSIGAMAALMRRARLLICNDTGVSHIAAGLRLASVVVFSKADINRWAPLDRRRHRCLWDPDGARVDAVLQQARALLDAAPAR